MKGWRRDGIQGFVREGIRGGLTILAAPLVIGAYLFSMPGLSGFPYAILPIASAVLAIVLFAKGRPNSGVFALIAFFLCGEIFTGTALDIVYSTFYVNAIWMAFGCFVLSVAGTRSGLVERLAEFVISRAGTGYASLIVGLVVIGFTLSLLVPAAIPRIILLLPIIIALSDSLGYTARSRGRTGLLLAGIMGAVVPSYAILPATVSSVMLQGSAEKLFSIEFSYGDYFLANFPALALPATVVAIVLLILLFRERPLAQPAAAPSRPLASLEIRTLIIAAVTVVLWATDHVHGLPVAWIAIGAATACSLPVIGPLRDVSVFQAMRPRIWVLLIAVLGALTLLNMTGLADSASSYVVDRLGFIRSADGLNYVFFILLAATVSVLFTVQAGPAIFATLAKDMGLATGWPLEGVLMVQVAAWVFLVFPYTAPALMIGMRTCGLRYRPVLTFLILYFAIGVCVILPLQFWWLHQLGYIP